MFRLARTEVEALNRSHFATGSHQHRAPPSGGAFFKITICDLKRHKGRPRATPQVRPIRFHRARRRDAVFGTKKPRAIAVNIQIMRAFVRMRELLNSNKELSRQFAQLEARLNKKLADHDEAIAAILSAIRELMNPPATKNRGIGFTAKL
jgi:hypothetical protein